MNAMSLYMNGMGPKGHTDHEQVIWLRPEEYIPDGEVAAFVKGDASANEVKQGQLGNCWFIGALSVLATNDCLLRGGDKYITYD